MRKMPVKTILNMIDMFGINDLGKQRFGRSEASRDGLTIRVFEQLKSLHKTMTTEKPQKDLSSTSCV